MIEIAKILKPQGIKGEVKAQPLTNLLAVFNNVESCIVGGKVLSIEKVSIRQGFLYIKFKEISSRNLAEELRNLSMKVDKSLLEEVKDDEDFLIDDLIGMLLYDLDGNFVGQIVDVESYGSVDNLIIEKEGRQIQAPFINGVFIKDGDKLKVDKARFDEVAIWK